MNKVILIGRLTRDPEIKGEGEKKAARFTLAVDKWTGPEKSADFISCVAFKRSADLMQEYTHQGTKIALEGRISTGSYTNREGKKVYTTEVVVDRFEFAESKKEETEPEQKQAAPVEGSEDAFMTAPDDSGELPFK